MTAQTIPSLVKNLSLAAHSSSHLLSDQEIAQFYAKIKLPQKNSRKGDNGKLLIIGGSKLFHAASRWSLEVASRLVDMVFYSSVPSNNRLIEKAKSEFNNGIVIGRDHVEDYLQEADCILIGPGIERFPLDEKYHQQSPSYYQKHPLTKNEINSNGQKLTNYFLAKYPDKKWVIDAGALQLVSPNLLNPHCILTPHKQELALLCQHAGIELSTPDKFVINPKWFNNATILLKGEEDEIFHQHLRYCVTGGNAGMTKGGTGDVLAGLLAGIYTTNSALESTIIASKTNKLAGESLYAEVGPFFNASDLAKEVPKVLWKKIELSKKI
ncbi:MAG TPA: NAD(P)H-hydrate dehydratase [Candidatus Woesebacteria bacterium]|nr:NAD(P)H-hydrate dehydratase [Candidatus Woesebacteria bacterium]